MITQIKCKIYEFSRKFLEPKWSNRLEQYVTTGFDREIGWETKKVPEKIADAVYNNIFRINDNYPPEKIALLAKEIENYAVLAVATGLVDDSDRPLVAYRYFWLEKPQRDNNIDGIGTLLQCWLDRNCPYFELKPSAEYRDYKNPHQASFLSKNQLMNSDRDVKNILNSILKRSYSYPMQLYIDRKLLEQPQKLHNLALLLNQEYNSDISWALDVNKLEYPEQFILICTKFNSQTQLIVNLPNYISNKSPDRAASFSHKIPDYGSNEQQLKRCLIDISRNNNLNSNFSILANYLEQFDSYQWKWKSILDETLLKKHDITTARYIALLAILKPSPEIFSWLDWLKQQENKEFWKAGINLQNQFVEYLDSNQLLEKTQFDDYIYELIDELLLIDFPIMLGKKQSRSKKTYNAFLKDREFLLIKSKSFWSKYFYDSTQYYVKTLVYQLKEQNLTINPNTDKFCKKILLDCQDWGANRCLSPQKKSFYEFIAQLFSQVKSYSLAAVFYQLSRGEVPIDVYAKAEIKIIPLEKSSRASGLTRLAIFNLWQEFKLLLANLTKR